MVTATLITQYSRTGSR